jgi:nickel/cobalt transporter (NiCoT) family protein
MSLTRERAGGGSLRAHLRFSPSEVRRLTAMYGFVVALHVAGFGLFAHFNSATSLQGPAGGALLYAGAAGTAYALGLRHAFDADHIAAIDDTTRYLLQKGKQPLGVGLAFSLGHSSVVFALSVGIAFAAQAAVRLRDGVAETGGLIGALVSGTFLYLIAGLNLVVLVGIIQTWRAARAGEHDQARLEELLTQRGLMNRLFGRRYGKMINHSWQLYFVGLLFGLGFDTATQVAAIGLAAGTAAGGSLPPLAIISLPLIFAAGMSLMDVTDGVFMSKAYSWAFTNPLRKIYYNITTTGLSIFIAFGIGTIQIVNLLSERYGFDDAQPFRALAALELDVMGIIVVVTFLLVWVGAVVLWKARRFDERYPASPPAAG